MVASGWFNDLFGRHEARWFSEGRPTSLVRDGAREGTDPATSQMSGSDSAATQVPENAPIGASDLARPSKWPVPGVASDTDGPSQSKRRVRGLWFMALGVLAIAGAII